MTASRILALGGAHVDRRGRIHAETAPGASNPGSWFVEAGGGAFNAARNLARLGHAVRLISPRGGDPDGEIVAAAAWKAGVEDTPFTFLDRTTPSYTAIIERDGNLVIALADMELYRLFSPRRIQQRAVREAFAATDAVITDANLPAETVAAIADAARSSARPAFGIAISPAKVVRFKECLPNLSGLFMNEAEARALVRSEPDDPRRWPDLLRAAGLARGVVTRGRHAAIAFDETGIAMLTPPLLEVLGDVTGAGDALASGFISAQLAGRPLGEALRQGAAAALIAVRSPLAVAEELEPDLLARVMGLVPDAEMLS
ncbi:carbohydrate kinase family protein [Rhizobium sp. TRM96647]|uniref:carbohydrate kinase family protein n=1 Tax=unclassified Rhizobium TaxID=2613769 RepID=UPI0021E97F79|nr:MULTISPECIES: carbohydrate kinase family protein [unclassified Rhizobium]MCV3737403.1 carbohydrate kinase family protein [Rhizobium sp. TRM96647]MCV3756507.1 carbohydrate kinase family protein [Rhizobium sp. TRM96650]